MSTIAQETMRKQKQFKIVFKARNHLYWHSHYITEIFTSQNMPQSLLLFCPFVDLLVLVLHLYVVMPGKSLDVNICCRL
jgi:hypothetical protein